MAQIYNDPAGGEDSSVGTQMRTDFYAKKALIESRKKQFFTQLADSDDMPKNHGKKIKRYHYLPLLDDANINDQGIDAAGLSINKKKSIIIGIPGAVKAASGAYKDTYYAVGEGVDDAAALVAAKAKALIILINLFKLTGADAADYDAAKAAAIVKNGTVDDTIDPVPVSGNLYGSSKDVGTITSKLPALSETGGRVNRVGFKRVEIEGTLEKFGFFDEYTQESLDFDSDKELLMHVNREMVSGATEISEDALQIDLLNSPGIVRFGGEATTDAEVTGEGTVSEISYEDLMRLAIDLADNRCPKHTKIITGSRLVDTKVIDAAMYLYIGSELIPSIRAMTDLFGNQAFIPVQNYASAGNIAMGEIGTIDQFRIIVVPEMMHWEGAGAAVGTNPGYRETGGNYDVFPMLVVGDSSFSTIGFQTDGKTVKFKIKHAKPGSTESYANDPFGETGFMSIKWYYGFLLKRPERIAVCKVVAEL